MKLFVLFIPLVFSLLMPPVLTQRIQKETMRYEGKRRTYYLFVPEKITTAAQTPRVVCPRETKTVVYG